MPRPAGQPLGVTAPRRRAAGAERVRSGSITPRRHVGDGLETHGAGACGKPRHLGPVIHAPTVGRPAKSAPNSRPANDAFGARSARRPPGSRPRGARRRGRGSTVGQGLPVKRHRLQHDLLGHESPRARSPRARISSSTFSSIRLCKPAGPGRDSLVGAPVVTSEAVTDLPTSDEVWRQHSFPPPSTPSTGSEAARRRARWNPRCSIRCGVAGGPRPSATPEGARTARRSPVTPSNDPRTGACVAFRGAVRRRRVGHHRRRSAARSAAAMGARQPFTFVQAPIRGSTCSNAGRIALETGSFGDGPYGPVAAPETGDLWGTLEEFSCASFRAGPPRSIR